MEATRSPHVEVTLALSPSLAESLKDRFEQRQLCVALRGRNRNPRLLAKAPGSCDEDPSAGSGSGSLFQVRAQSGGEAEAAEQRSLGPQELVSVLVEISWRDYKLCASSRNISVSLSRDCGANSGSGGSSLWELQRAGEGHESLPSEPCLWLKAKSQGQAGQEQGESPQRYLALQDRGKKRPLQGPRFQGLVRLEWPLTAVNR